jgi:hypothetical protein
MLRRHSFRATPFLYVIGLDCFFSSQQDSPHPGFVLAYSRILKDDIHCFAAALHAQGDTRRHASPTYAP